MSVMEVCVCVGKYVYGKVCVCAKVSGCEGVYECLGGVCVGRCLCMCVYESECVGRYVYGKVCVCAKLSGCKGVCV